jgi:hypothetical protein
MRLRTLVATAVASLAVLAVATPASAARTYRVPVDNTPTWSQSSHNLR